MKPAKEKLGKKLKSLAPPGSNVKTTIRLFSAEIAIMILISAIVVVRITDANSVLDLAYFNNMMPHFSEVLSESFVFFWALVLFNISFGVANYTGFYKNKSVYVMKRIPDSKEMFRRSFALPFAGIALALISAIIFLIIYYLLYRYLPPPDRIYPVQFTDFLRAFI